MKDVAPAIPRLGVPEYNWWNEALHGVARSGLATVFPQAIGLAATWNDSLMLRIATVISDEARAKYHDYIAPRQPSALSGAHVLVAEHQHLSRSALGSRPGDVRRGSVSHRHDRRAVHSRVAGQRSEVPQDRVDGEAFRGAQRPGAGAPHVRRGRERTRSARELPAALRDGHQGRRRVLAHVRVQPHRRQAGVRQRHAAARTSCATSGSSRATSCPTAARSTTSIGVTSSQPRPAEAAADGVKTGTDLECRSRRPTPRGRTRRVCRRGASGADHRGGDRRLGVATCSSRGSSSACSTTVEGAVGEIPISDLDSPMHHALAMHAARESMVLLKNERNTLPLTKS